MESSSERDTLSVVIGTYHCTVAQFDFDLEVGTCNRRWVDDTATKSISSIVFNGFFGIFGGNDELVRIVNVASNQSVGALHEHQGSITHLETFQNTHLLSSSDDGKIYIWEIGGGHKRQIKGKKNMAKSWECLCCMHHLYNIHGRKKSKKKQKKGETINEEEEQALQLELSSNRGHAKIITFSVHPSGRLMLSIDAKHEMKIWDLIRAKCIVTVKMPKPAIDIRWSPNGLSYAVVRDNKALIYTKEGALHKVIKPVMRMIGNEFYDRYQSTIVAFTYVTFDMVAIADMSARVVVFDIDTKTPLFRLSGHEVTDDVDVDVDGNEDEDDGDDDEDADQGQQQPPQQQQSQQQQEEEEEQGHSMPRIQKLKSVSLNESVYLVSADNRGRICVWNVHQCLSRVIEINAQNSTQQQNEEIDVEGVDQDGGIEANANKNKVEDADAGDAENGGGDEEDGDDYRVDENDLYTFPALMQVDTDTHITCMDAGLVGRLNLMYKWRKPKKHAAADVDDDELGDEEDNAAAFAADGDNVADDDDEDDDLKEKELGHKRTLDEMQAETAAPTPTQVVDSDDDAKFQNSKKKRQKKKKKSKKPKIDLSRFD